MPPQPTVVAGSPGQGKPTYRDPMGGGEAADTGGSAAAAPPAAAASPPTSASALLAFSPASTLPSDSFPVYVNVYDIVWANALLYPVGMGIHHTGVEVHGSEFGFGRTISGTGLFEIRPKSFPQHIFRESLLVGYTSLNLAEVRQLIREESSMWAGATYHLTNRNCNHFSDYLVKALTHRPVAPASVQATGTAAAASRNGAPADGFVPNYPLTAPTRLYGGTPRGAGTPKWVNRLSKIANAVPLGFSGWLDSMDRKMQGM